jgi:integrase
MRLPPAITIFLSERSVSERTQRSYESVLRPFAAELLQLEVLSVTPVILANYLNGRTLSPTTFARYRAIFSAFFSFAIEKGWALTSPVNRSLKRKQGEAELKSDESFRYFSETATQGLLAATVPSPRLHTITLLKARYICLSKTFDNKNGSYFHCPLCHHIVRNAPITRYTSLSMALDLAEVRSSLN